MEDHSRVIVHIDIDCFYAQVEMNKNPKLKTLPLGILQKSIIVTSNYIAREFGITKCMPVSEAKNCCPDLILVNGEDLHDYREISYKITELLQKYSELVERLGFDENFIDVTNLVNKKFNDSNKHRKENVCIFGDCEVKCDCGCTERLNIGNEIAADIRQLIFDELTLTTCAGIAHNKLLAKVACGMNKPNKQTLVYPNNGSELMLNLKLAKCIPSIGVSTANELLKLNIVTVSDLQNSKIEQLAKLFGNDKAKFLWNLSYGIDTTEVKKSGKPQSLGIEDSCKALTTEKEIECKLRQLLQRLMILLKEDGRIPNTIKLVVRKELDIKNPIGNRETRQCNVYPLFQHLDLTPTNEIKLMSMIMTLFRKAVDVRIPFRITLIGLGFTKFIERPTIKNTLHNYLTNDLKISRTDIESISSKASTSQSPRVSESLGIKRRDSDDTQSPIKLECFTHQKSNTLEDSLKNSSCPPGVDEEVFRCLPNDIQNELWENYKAEKRKQSEIYDRPFKKPKVNSILNYVTREKKL